MKLKKNTKKGGNIFHKIVTKLIKPTSKNNNIIPLQYYNKYKNILTSKHDINDKEIILHATKFLNLFKLNYNKMNPNIMLNEIISIFKNEQSHTLTEEILKQLIKNHNISIQLKPEKFIYIAH